MERDDLHIVHPHAAGIDIGADKVFVSVAADGVVRAFDTFTSAYQALIAYLKQAGVRTVAMEATGVYWITLYQMLEEADLEVWLVNGAHARNVPGRKSDVQDCQWLRQLHSYGLLRRCFVPDEEMMCLRAYVRQRQGHLERAAMHVQHMQKALELMNLKLHRVLSQIHGTSGMKVLQAILGGERDAERLAGLCHGSILKRKRTEVLEALQGHYRPEHVFALGQAVEAYEFAQAQARACDEQIEAVLQQLAQQQPEVPGGGGAGKPIRHNRPEVADLHELLVRLHGGTDLSRISGLTDLSVLKLVTELGTDLSRWPSEKHFTSWAGLSPGSQSSGKRRRNRMGRKRNRVGQIFRECAQPISRSKHLALSGFYQRVKARRGAAVALCATARKLAELYWRMCRYGLAYVEQGLERYQQQYEARRQRYLEKQARLLGFQLVPISS